MRILNDSSNFQRRLAAKAYDVTNLTINQTTQEVFTLMRTKNNIKTYKILFFCVFLPVLLTHHSFLNPIIGYANQEEKTSIKKATKQKGWELPWIRHNVIFSVKSEKIKIQNTTVTEKQLIPTNDLLMVLETYSLKEKTDLVTNTYVCYIKGLYAYENESARFGYKAILEPVELSVDGGIKQSYGFVFVVYYYDDDGNGTFETLEFDAKEPRLSFNTK